MFLGIAQALRFYLKYIPASRPASAGGGLEAGDDGTLFLFLGAGFFLFFFAALSALSSLPRCACLDTHTFKRGNSRRWKWNLVLATHSKGV